jgi:hypothetical protein
MQPSHGLSSALPFLMQSTAHVEQVSPASQTPLPHAWHCPQSVAHDVQFSNLDWHDASPQYILCPGTSWHDEHIVQFTLYAQGSWMTLPKSHCSPDSIMPFPHEGCEPETSG